jgi:hypothetical protein
MRGFTATLGGEIYVWSRNESRGLVLSKSYKWHSYEVFAEIIGMSASATESAYTLDGAGLFNNRGMQKID